MEEIWKNIKGSNGYYQVSNLGNIRSKKRKVNTCVDTRTFKSKLLKQIFNQHNGYKSVYIKYNDKQYRTKYIHRLVAEAFIPNPLNKREVNHINGNKLDNRVENLEWTTREENIQHAYKIGLMKKSVLIETHQKYAKKVVMIKNNGDIKIFNSQKSASRELGMYPTTIKWICRDSKTHKYKDYRLYYEDEYNVSMQGEEK